MYLSYYEDIASDSAIVLLAAGVFLATSLATTARCGLRPSRSPAPAASPERRASRDPI